MLAVLTQMYPKPKDPKEPYGPMLVLTDGQHTPVPANYRGKVEELSALAGRATNHVLRARLADITWLLQRKRFECAHAALESYVAIVNQLDAQAAAKNAAYENEPDIIAKIRALGALAHNTSDYLRRALHIGHAIGRDKPVNQPVRDLAKSLRQRSKAETNPTVLYRWNYLDLEFGLSEAAQIGADIETYLSTVRHEDARAFIRFFQYDMPSALYTLTPLLENVLRYILKQRGKDTSTIDTNTREQKRKRSRSSWSR
jgi:hypothetical protein